MALLILRHAKHSVGVPFGQPSASSIEASLELGLVLLNEVALLLEGQSLEGVHFCNKCLKHGCVLITLLGAIHPDKRAAELLHQAEKQDRGDFPVALALGPADLGC